LNIQKFCSTNFVATENNVPFSSNISASVDGLGLFVQISKVVK